MPANVSDGSQTEVPFLICDVCFTPDSDQTADIEQGREVPIATSRPGSFNHLVCSVEQRRRHGEAERLSGRKIDRKPELGRRLNRQIRRISSL
jgi:hypothetical protein